jgi:hypothetical protein
LHARNKFPCFNDRPLINEINNQLAGRQLLAASNRSDNSRAASESADDRILARDTSQIMMPSPASPEMAALLGLSEDELDKPSHAFTTFAVADHFTCC